MQVLTHQFHSHSAVDTENIGVSIGRVLRGGEVIELISDLGGGKTTFVRGLARGMGSYDKVASPTFTISREYKSNQLTLYHYDFYRLREAGIVADELGEVVDDPVAVVVIEWGEIVANVLPEERLTVQIIATGETERKLIFSYPDHLAYLVPREQSA